MIEAVFENLEVKQKLFGELEAVVPPETIIASNTSSIRIASIARALKHRGRVCGMHYFNPVPLMKLVEVIRAADTAPDVVTAIGGARQAPDPRARRGRRHAGLSGQSRRHRDRHRGPADLPGGRASPSQIDAVMRGQLRLPHGPVRA